MVKSFNLIDEPWLPCLMADGERREFGIGEVLIQAHDIRELRDESPLITAALHRMLLAILHRVFGPSSMFKWQELWNAAKFPDKPLAAYLDRWRDRFDLFHDRWPFYQTGGMTTEKPLPASALFEELASGNNATLFDHTTELSSPGFAPSRAACGLVMRQGFSLGLGVSPAITLNGKKIKTGNRQDGPLARGVVLIVKDDSLFQTLILNLSEYESSDSDIPIWERDSPEDQVSKTDVDGRLDLYTAQCRRLRLEHPDSHDGLVRWVHFAQGRKLTDEVDPMKPYQVKDETRGPQVIGLNEGKALWRDSTALFELAKAQRSGEPDLGAAALKLIYEAVDGGVLPQGFEPQINLFGLATQKGKATSVIFWRHERLPLPLAYVTDNTALLGDLKKSLSIAEEVADALAYAVRNAVRVALSPTDPNKADKDRVTQMASALAPERLYWSRLEEPFLRLIVELPGDTTHRVERLHNWFNDTLKPTAFDAYRRTAGTLESSARALRAAVTGEQRLAYQLGKVAGEHDLNDGTSALETSYVEAQA